MSRNTRSLAVLVVLAVPLGLYKAWWGVRVASLPALTADVLDEGTSLAQQREAWLRWNEALQCEALDPCLATIKIENWEGNPGAISRACTAAHNRVEALYVPPDLPTAVRRNVDLLRDFWLSETEGLAARADGSAWRGFLDHDLDSCTANSIPAQIDHLYEVTPADAPPATCAQIRAALGSSES